jgi:hypothetical protein
MSCELFWSCKYSEIYYKNKGEWPNGVPQEMVKRINNSAQCTYAPYFYEKL